MAWRVEQNPTTGQPEIVVDGWENGIGDSPYTGLASMLNLNNHYYNGALYSNYQRTDARGGNTIGVPEPYLFTMTNPSGNSGTNIGNNTFLENQYIIADQSGKTWAASARSNWATFVNHTIPDNVGNSKTGIAYYSPTFNNNAGTGDLYTFAFGVDISENYQTLYYSHFETGAWSAWTATPFWGPALFSTIITQGTPNYMLWSSNDNILYICNGPYISSLQPGSNDFNPGGSTVTDYIFQQKALILPQYENAVWLEEWNGNLLIASGNRIYVWDFFTATPSYFIQLPEPISKMKVVKNVIYILAGYKGNIYVSYGYTADVLKKVPDSFFGQTDPTLVWGGIMYHRNRLWFGLASQTQTGTSGYMSGIFSLAINGGTYVPETPGALVMENQNSFGLFQASAPNDSTASSVILFDVNDAGQDFYYSVWNNNSVHGIDKSSATIYESGETVIEGDLVPVGTYLTQTTPINVEFKLDAPMTAGDSITILARQSFTDSYVQFGDVFTSTGTEVSWLFPSALRGIQWLQVKAIITTVHGDNVRLKEVRIRNGR